LGASALIAWMLMFSPLPARAAGPNDAAPGESIDWQAAIRAAGPTLSGMPWNWQDQAFTGNGREGMLVGFADGALSIRLGRSDVVDRRETGDKTIFRPCFDAGRLPIGRLVVRPRGKVDPKKRSSGTIDLWNAEGVGAFPTDQGEVKWRVWTPMGAPVNVVEIEVAGGVAVEVSFRPDPAMHPRSKGAPKGYAAHPPAVPGREGDVELSTQAFPLGGGYTVAWRAVTTGSRTIVVSATGYDRTGDGHRAEALDSLRAAGDLESLRARHRAWWAAWWSRGAIVVPDTVVQRYYWLQLYKLGSAVRGDGPMLDLMGPWYGEGPWPSAWWNLNVQLSYQLCAPANRADLLDSLVGMIERNADAMGRCVPPQWGGPHAIAVGRISSYDGTSLIEAEPEAGNLTWALAVCWDGYRLTGDRKRAERLLPLMARAAAFHVARAKPGPDGRLHLPASSSPESGKAPDALDELGPMRWLLRTLVAAEREHGWKHPDQVRWREVLETLTPLPSDEKGYLKGAGAKVELGHRHWSHLLHVYPLRDFDPTDAAELDLVRRSVAHWTSNKSQWRGYSGLGASSMWSLLAETEKAKPPLPAGSGNTLYREAGPVIETPLQAAATLQEMLLTWDRRGLRLFAGTPAEWRDASFHNLRAPVGLTVSAKRQNGSTQWVRLEAAVPRAVRIEPRFSVKPEVRPSKSAQLMELGGGWYEVKLEAGQSVLLTVPNPVIVPPNL